MSRDSSSWTSRSAVSTPTPTMRASRRTIAWGPVSGCCSNRFWRASSISLIWLTTTPSRAMSRCSSAKTFGGNGMPSGVCTVARRSAALRRVGLKLRMPSRARVDFIRLTHRRAKTDRLDTELLKRGFLGWLRGERGHCSMARVPTIAEEDGKRPNRERDCLVGERTRIVNRIKSTLARLGIRNFKPTLRKAAERLATVHTPEGVPLPPTTLAELQRDMARLGFVVSQIREIEEARQKRLEQETETGPHAMVRQVVRVIGIGIETADMLVHEVLSRPMRDRKAVARYAGLTGSPDESGARRREQGLARAGNARVRRGMIQLAWRFLRFQKQSALAQWYRARTADSRLGMRKTMIVALARKLLIALWRFVTTGEILEGVILRPAG